MTETNEIWEQVRQFYKDNFDTLELVELATNFDILAMCARGASNESIANTLELDVEIVKYIIDRHLGFMGWEQDLEFNPLMVYENIKDSDEHAYETFVNELVEFKAHEKYNLKVLYQMAEQVHYIERLLNEKWI